MDRPGLFIALEGTDGAGKSTQFDLLAKKIIDAGYKVETLQFPRYKEESSHFVREYLKGKFGDSNEVGPYTASLFYALDRYHASEQIKKWLNEGKIVLADRFTGSNMAHQGSFFDQPEQRKGFFLWLDQIEYDMLKIPRPDISLVLRVPSEIASSNVDKRGEEKDIHEKDRNHSKRTVEVYDNLCELFPKDFKRVDCVRNGTLMDKQSISSLLWNIVQPILPEAPTKKKDPPLTLKSDKVDIESAVTNTTDNIYALTNMLPPQTIAAAMARLSRRKSDLRQILADEFLYSPHKSEGLLKRVISEYGDDSVQQLAGQYFVVEGASNLLTKKIESCRMGSYLEQSTRYIFFDEQDKNGNYQYYIPDNLSEEVKAMYIKSMDKIFGLYSHMANELTEHILRSNDLPENERDGAFKAAVRAKACDAIRGVLPVAVKSTVGVFASAQTVEHMVEKLLADDLLEVRTAGKKILAETRKVIPSFLERADKAGRGAEYTKYLNKTKQEMRELNNELINNRFSVDMENVKLDNYFPKNELSICADILYEESNLSMQELKNELENIPVSNKAEIINGYIGTRSDRRHKPGRAFENVHYSFSLLSDYGIFRDLSRHRIVNGLVWQELSPRYGYQIPDLIEEAGLEEDYIECFDTSLKLHSEVQRQGFIYESQYSTLLGHRMRWNISFNAREAYHILELRTSNQGHPGYRELAQQMYEQIEAVHPLIAKGMSFINTNSDPDLARLQAEKRKQAKLRKLDSR